MFGNDYSVDPSAIGLMVDVHADLRHVTVQLNRRVVATHQRAMCSAAKVTDRGHVTAANALRVRFQTPVPEETAESLQRNLADYDAAFDVNFDQSGEIAR